MKKLIILFIVLFSNLTFSENFSCDPKKFLSPDTLTKVIKHRDSALNVCLNCEGNSCAFKSQLLADQKSLAICKRLFCTASYASRGYEMPADSPRGKSSFSYQYAISEKGKIIDIKVNSVEGVFSSKDVVKFIKALTRKTRFQPIEFDGNFYQLKNLTSEMTLNTRLEQE